MIKINDEFGTSYSPTVEQACYKLPILLLSDTDVECWVSNGKLHRQNYPAVIHPSGYKEWWTDGYLHRLDGPAIEFPNGDFEWYKYHKLHREDGPAIDYYDTEIWFKNGIKHRIDGPAFNNDYGILEYYINGQLLSKEDFDLYSEFYKNGVEILL